MSEPGIPEQPDEATRTTPAVTGTVTMTATPPETATTPAPAPEPATTPEPTTATDAKTVTDIPAPTGPGRPSTMPRTLPALALPTIPAMAPVALEPAPVLEDVTFPFPQRSAPGRPKEFLRRLFRRR